MSKKGEKQPDWLIKKRVESRLKKLKNKGIWRKCKWCKKKIYVKPCLMHKHKFCTQTCSNKYNGLKMKVSRKGKGNPMYGKKAWNSGKIGVVIGLRGKDNHHWKGGICSIEYRIRRCSRNREWRKKIFERDNFTCQRCNTNERLEPHHKKSIRELIKEYFINNLDDAYNCKELWDINNGETYCNTCHHIVENEKKKGKNPGV